MSRLAVAVSLILMVTTSAGFADAQGAPDRHADSVTTNATSRTPMQTTSPAAPPADAGSPVDRVSPDTGTRAGPALTKDLPLAHPREVGMNPATLDRLDRVIEDAIHTGAIPGVALAIGRHGKLVRLRGYGHTDPRPGYPLVTDSTIYDLASLTKVVGTTTAVMLLVEDGRLDLDAPVSYYLPEWNDNAAKRRVTVRQLLEHTAGLPAYAPLWRESTGRGAFLHRIAHLELEYEPGTKVVYSDLGMILVGLIVEKITGQTLDVFLEEMVFRPLGMTDTGFNPRTWQSVLGPDQLPLEGASPATAVTEESELPLPARADPPGDPALLTRIAPTEIDRRYRMTHLHGVVHDENAYALGGVAGHAGLFSSARDLARFAHFILAGGTYLAPDTTATGAPQMKGAEPSTMKRLASCTPKRSAHSPPAAGLPAPLAGTHPHRARRLAPTSPRAPSATTASPGPVSGSIPSATSSWSSSPTASTPRALTSAT